MHVVADDILQHIEVDFSGLGVLPLDWAVSDSVNEGAIVIVIQELGLSSSANKSNSDKRVHFVVL